MRLSKFISRILHPIFIPSITMVIVVKKFLNIIILQNQASAIIIASILFTLLFPLLSVIYLLFKNKIESLEMSKKEERFLPLLITICWMLIGFYVIRDILGFSPVIKTIYLGAIYTLSISMIITRRWKISLHMLAIGGASGTFLILQLLYGGVFYVLTSSLFISGLIGYSRLDQNAHTAPQIYAGFLLGFIMMCLSILYL
jgi:membrane-associated phospholipid phosphatase